MKEGLAMSLTRIIESEHNEFYKKLVSIKEGKMKKEGMIFIEGEDLLKEALQAKRLSYAFSYDQKYFIPGIPMTLIKQGIYRKLSSYQSLPHVMGVAKFEYAQDLGDKVVYLDGVQDPGNVGTIIRTALAFHYSSLVLSKDCASIYNSKTVQSTKGALFKINIASKDLKELKERGYHIYLTTLDGEDERKIDKLIKPFCLVLGNEGQGIRKEHLSYGKKIKIAMDGIDSLNVAMAGAIFLYRFRD